MEEYDLLIIVDATVSMDSYLTALNTSLPQIISISALTGSFSRIGLLAYRDYSTYRNYLDDLLEWSGWLHQDASGEGTSQPDLIDMAKHLNTIGNMDWPEATKTAFAKAYEVMRPDAKTLIILYTDAPPHAHSTHMRRTSNGEVERQSLTKEDSYGTFGPSFLDWVSATNMLCRGEKKAQVFSILARRIGHDAAIYNFMSTMTGGSCILLSDSTSPQTVAKVTVEICLSWMGVENPPTATSKKSDAQDLPAHLSRYISDDSIAQIESEASKEAGRFMPFTDPADATYIKNVTEIKLNADAMRKYLPKCPKPIQNFTERWKTDDAYKRLTFEHLLAIMHADVRAIALNPVFGTLWRTICNDRAYDNREILLEAFSTSLNKLRNEDDKAMMKAWLEESYDFSADVLAMINSVPQEEQYPCVVLDPTQTFPTFHAEGYRDEDNKPLADLIRVDLMEIGRSCHASILRRLSRILTRLTFVNSADDLPAHLANTSTEKVPRLPLALTEKKYSRGFWKILLHLIVPGTMLSARPAALVAALSLRLGMEFLLRPAVSQMLAFKDNWNGIATPENWTVGCLTLLIDADKIYQQHQQYLATKGEVKGTTDLLNPSDRALFEKLVAFKMLEFNLDAPLTARVPWTPKKSIAPIGPLITCRSCHYPRSVTVMGQSGKCGTCLATDYTSPEEKERSINQRVSTDDTTTSEATWVECSDRSCRAQYIVYDVEALKVRPKCHYCRNSKESNDTKQKPELAPVVQCKLCRNHMIWPEVYRPSSFDESQFVCPPCMSGRDPAVDVNLAASKIAMENTFAWLICDKENAEKVPFENRSILHTITSIGPDEFLSRIELFPSYKEPLLHLGKPILNMDSLISTIQESVANRQPARTECSLCFSKFHPRDLNPACGRRACLQRICTKCLNSWYGLNAPGRIIHPAALACPFCRRLPAAQTLAKYGMGIHAVRDLSNAVRDKGTMIYAWCRSCSTARQYMERDCARGAPPEIRDWTCNECLEDQQRRDIEFRRRQAQQMIDRGRIARDAAQVEAAERRREEVEKEAKDWEMARVKPCPQCGIISQRIDGCGHLKCPVSSCQTDWCWYCGQAYDEFEIYDHMRDAHGGFYGADDGDFLTDDDDDDDDDDA